MSFIDGVIENRDRLDKITDRAAREMARALEDARQEAIKRVKERIKKYEKDGKIADSLRARKELKSANADIQDALDEALGLTTRTLKAAKREAFKKSFADTIVNVEAATGDEVSLGGSFNQVFRKALARSESKPVLGVKDDKAFEGVRKWSEKKLRSTFTEAIARGDGADTLARKISDITGVGQRAATRIARTNMTAVMNDAQKAVYDENSDVIRGYRWNATLDGRTSLICATLHGKEWRIGEDPPGPPAHPNCRSVLIPVFKDEELQAEIDADEQRVRNIGGKGTQLIDGETTFEEWLDRQSKDDRVEFIGSEIRETLWDKGYVKFEELVKPDLTPRTDEEAVQLALAKDPSNRELRGIADEMEVKKKKLADIRREERSLARKQEFDQGE